MQGQLQVHFSLRGGNFNRRNFAHWAIRCRSPARRSVVSRNTVAIRQMNDGELLPACPAKNFDWQISPANVDRSLLLSCVHFLHDCCSSDSLDVLRDDLLGWRSIDCRVVFSGSTLSDWPRTAFSNHGYGYRARRATMAGVAGNRLL